MAKILRGEIRWADLNPVRGSEQGGHRPVLILSQDVFNERSGTVIFCALAITGQPQQASFPLTFELNGAELPKRSWVKMHKVKTVRNGGMLKQAITGKNRERRIIGIRVTLADIVVSTFPLKNNLT
ncbi:MAG: type II toxin-antitoxin system PemK/MazF family toxin [Pseudomonadota bacterium]